MRLERLQPRLVRLNEVFNQARLGERIGRKFASGKYTQVLVRFLLKCEFFDGTSGCENLMRACG